MRMRRQACVGSVLGVMEDGVVAAGLARKGLAARVLWRAGLSLA